jgi:hypothetical protein
MAMDPKQERALRDQGDDARREDEPREISDETRQRAGKAGGQDAGRTGGSTAVPGIEKPAREGMGEDHR